MSRLVQGDVGAGKTVVALMAMAAVAESGAQSALMAPTELLATQHYKTLAADLREAPGSASTLLTGKKPAAERRAIRERHPRREASTIVGGHARPVPGGGRVPQPRPHRGGRAAPLRRAPAAGAVRKGQHADLLVMTATPIPRTLVLTHFGDMSVSLLREKPRGRQPIDTAVLSISEYARVIARLQGAHRGGRAGVLGTARWSRRARHSTWCRPKTGSPT